MSNSIFRKLFLGFIQIHILHHADKKPIFGSWMIEELKNHGYKISAGTLYPILQKMEKSNLLKIEKINVNGKIRKYYQLTSFGKRILNEAKIKAKELFTEINE